MEFEINKYGNKGAIIEFPQEISLNVSEKVQLIYEGLRISALQGVMALTPGYNSIVVYLEPTLLSLTQLKDIVIEILENSKNIKLNSYSVTLPVCYEGTFSIDINNVIKSSGLSVEEIIKVHTQDSYRVYMLGFVPGFLYLGGMSELINTPRLTTPRTKIPKGAVGIAGNQTGIYPIATPGGWQIIGNCPLDLIGTGESPLIEMGDIINFKSIGLEEHKSLQGQLPKRTLTHEN